LADAEKAALVRDPEGFVASTAQPCFARYVAKVLVGDETTMDLAAASRQAALSPSQQANLFSHCILEQEFAASVVSSFGTTSINLTAGRSGAESSASAAGPPPLVLLVADRTDTMFGYGLQERIRRNLALLERVASPEQPSQRGQRRVASMLLNPSAQDSLSPTVQLRLALAYGPFLPEQRPLADYLWFAQSPSVRLLTHCKNAVSREGAKPAGEFSILGAF
jgi:hypothetical protein